MSLQAQFRLQRPGFLLDAGLELAARGVTAIYGPSGCGKTTLLRCLAGLDRAAGHCRLDGATLQDQDGFVPAHQRRIGVVFQDVRLFPHLSVAGNLRYGARRGGGGPELERLVELLGIGGLLQRAPAQLSGGEAQRVAIARALLARPRLLLLDEPLAAVDPGRKRDILPYLERLSTEAGVPMLYVTHSLDEVASLADHLVLMEAGRVVADGPFTAMLARTDLPVTQYEDVGAVLEGEVARQWPEYHLTAVRVGAAELWLPREQLPPGRPVRVRVHARDVALMLRPPEHSSVLNSLPAQIAEVAADGAPGQCLVRLQLADGQPLLARISELSRERLGLRPGLSLYAQIKAAALT